MESNLIERIKIYQKAQSEYIKLWKKTVKKYGIITSTPKISNIERNGKVYYADEWSSKPILLPNEQNKILRAEKLKVESLYPFPKKAN